MAQAATAPARRAPARTGAPRRRAAGPAAAPRRPVAVPRRAAAQPRSGLAVAAVGAVSHVADSGVVLGLTRSRLWIGLLGSLLVGIVALNVMALSFNAASSETAGYSDELRERNSALRADIADGLSNERLQTAAVRIGLVMPQAASALMLTPSAGDAAEAARRLRQGDFTLGSTYTPAVAEVPVEAAVDPAAATIDSAAVTPVTDSALTTDATTPTTTDATTPTTTPVATETGGGVTP